MKLLKNFTRNIPHKEVSAMNKANMEPTEETEWATKEWVKVNKTNS